jgi:hypothetical protein
MCLRTGQPRRTRWRSCLTGVAATGVMMLATADPAHAATGWTTYKNNNAVENWAYSHNWDSTIQGGDARTPAFALPQVHTKTYRASDGWWAHSSNTAYTSLGHSPVAGAREHCWWFWAGTGDSTALRCRYNWNY